MKYLLIFWYGQSQGSVTSELGVQRNYRGDPVFQVAITDFKENTILVGVAPSSTVLLISNLTAL